MLYGENLRRRRQIYETGDRNRRDFFKSDDPEKLYQWYENHLGIRRNETGAVAFESGLAYPAAQSSRQSQGLSGLRLTRAFARSAAFPARMLTTINPIPAMMNRIHHPVPAGQRGTGP